MSPKLGNGESNTMGDSDESGRIGTGVNTVRTVVVNAFHAIVSIPARLSLIGKRVLLYNATYQIYDLKSICDKNPEKFDSMKDKTTKLINAAEKSGNDVSILQDRLNVLQVGYEEIVKLNEAISNRSRLSISPAHNEELKILTANNLLADLEFEIQLLRQNNFTQASMPRYQKTIEESKQEGFHVSNWSKEFNSVKSKFLLSHTENDAQSLQMSEFNYHNLWYYGKLIDETKKAGKDISTIQPKFNQDLSVLEVEYNIFRVKSLLAYAENRLPLHKECLPLGLVRYNATYQDLIDYVRKEGNSVPTLQPTFDQAVSALQLKYDTLIVKEYLTATKESAGFICLERFIWGSGFQGDMHLVNQVLERNPTFRPAFDTTMADLEIQYAQLCKEYEQGEEYHEYIARIAENKRRVDALQVQADKLERARAMTKGKYHM